jgi:hypothetical protein
MNTPTNPICGQKSPLPLSGHPPGGQNALNQAETANKQRLRAARYRAKPGVRAKEAARLRAWRLLKRTLAPG